METQKKQRINQITFILSGVLFTLGGLLLVLEGKEWLGLIQLTAAVCNFGLALVKRSKFIPTLIILVFLLNILVAGSVAWDYVLSGKKYLQYAWLLAALLSLVALLITLRKRKLAAHQLSESER